MRHLNQLSSPYIAVLLITFSLIGLPTSSFAQDRTMLLTDHPLADTIWDLATGDQLNSMQKITAAMTSADYVLLGEKHDNPEHHALQASAINAIAATGRKADVVFEMIEPRHQVTLDDTNRTFAMKPSECVGHTDISKAKKEAFDGLGDKLDWEKRGWPAWSIYQSIFKSALDSGMTLHAGNPNRDLLMLIARGGSMDKTQLKDLKWDQNYSDANKASLLNELVDAHCGMMDRNAVAPLVTLQKLKDTHMARAMRQAKRSDRLVVLIAGNGHTRKDRGVPLFLSPQDKVVSVAFVEVVRGEANPSNYPAFDPGLYDFVHFTPRLDEIDPCERFRKQLEQMKSKAPKRAK